MDFSAVFCVTCDWYGFFNEFITENGFRCPLCGNTHIRQVPETDEDEEIMMIYKRLQNNKIHL